MYTIEDLKNGKCAVKNDGTLEELKQVLKLAFPKDWCNEPNSFMSYTFYFTDTEAPSCWLMGNTTILPTQSVKDFLNQKNKQMKKITWQQAQELIDEAYPDFQIILAQEWGRNIVLKCDIHISEEFYNQLKVHFSRDEALMVFNKIFGTECPYNDGDPVWVRDSEEQIWLFRYSTGKFENGKVQVYELQKKTGIYNTWDLHMPFDPNNLPIMI